MSRYIDVDSLIPETVTVLEYGGDDGRRLYGSKIQVYSKKQIDEAPTADVRENVRGEWTHRTNHTQTCSVCGSRIYEREDYNFCPNCGADMRGGSYE